MLQFLLDTDHLTLFEQGHPGILRRFIPQAGNDIGLSAITVEESLRGRLALLAQARDGPTRIHRYAMLVGTVRLFEQFPIVSFDQASENQFQQLQAMKLRVGTQDLKMGAIALVNHLTVVTRNRRDFSRIPGIALDDWSV